MADLNGVFSQRRSWHTREYLNVLASERWRNLKAHMMAEFGECGECGCKEGLELHHFHYDNLGYETEKDVELVCKPCHKRLDEEREHETAVLTFARKKFGINHCYSWSYIEREFFEWLERKNYE